MGEKEQMRSLSLSSRIYNDTAYIHDVQEDECRINNNNNDNNNGIKHRTNRTIERLLLRTISTGNDDNNTSDSSLSSSKNKFITYQQSLFLLFLVISVTAFISEFFATSNSQNNNGMSRSRSSDNDVANNPIHIQNGIDSVVGKSKSNDLLVQSSGGILAGINYVEEEEAKQLKAKQLKATEEEAKQRKAKEVEEEAKQLKAKEEEAKQRKAKEVEEGAKQHKAKEAKQLKAKEEEAKQRKAKEVEEEAKQLKAKEEEAKQRKAVPGGGGGGGGGTNSSSSSSSMIVTTTIPHCILDDGPIPVILMTMGRSGSTGIWQALGKLTGYDTFNEGKAKLEYVGEDQIQQRQFFHDKKWEGRKDKNGQWLLHYMCKLRHTTFKDATFVGFKWKSWLEFLLTKEGKNTLQLIALLAKDEDKEEDEVITSLHDSSTTTTTTTIASSTGSAVTTAKQRQRQRSPPIRIIRSRRNPIDVQLSFYKHRLYTKKKRKDKGGNGAVQYLPAHCKDNDKDCLQKHYELGEHQIIQNLDQFFKDTYQRWNEENKIDVLLVEMNVPVIFLSYDTLYYPSSKEECGDGENEWNKALNFVRGGVISNSNNDNSNSNSSNSNNSNSNGSRNNNTNKTETVCIENIDSEYYKSWKQIQDAMGYGSTTRTRNHKELISNWLEVQQKFMGTSLEQFLRLS